MNKKKYIGIDIGGTAVKIGSVDEDGTIHATETYAVNFDGYETPILQTVVKSCHNFLNMQESGCQQREQSLQKKEWSKEPQDILKTGSTARFDRRWSRNSIFRQKCLMMRMQRLLGKRGLVLQRAKKMLSLSRLEQV